MARRFLKPFYVDNELITNIEQLKEILKTNPEKLVFSIQDGSLKEFLLGINTEYAEIISKDNIENSLKQLSEKLGIKDFRFNIQKVENEKYLTNEKDIISKIKTEDEIIIGKGHFHLGSLTIDRPIKIKGQGVNFTILEFDKLKICCKEVIFEDLFVKGNDYDCPNNLTPIFKSTRVEFKNIFDRVIIGSKDKRKKWEIKDLIKCKNEKNKYINLDIYIEKNGKLIFEDSDIEIENCTIYVKNNRMEFVNSNVKIKNSSFSSLNKGNFDEELRKSISSEKKEPNALLLLTNSKGNIENVDFLHGEAGIKLQEKSDVEIKVSNFEDNIIGLILINSKGKIVECKLKKNILKGIKCKNSITNIEKTKFKNNYYGIDLTAKSIAYLMECEFKEEKFFGISCNNSEVKALKSDFVANKWYSMWINENSEAEIIECKFLKNIYGINCYNSKIKVLKSNFEGKDTIILGALAVTGPPPQSIKSIGISLVGSQANIEKSSFSNYILAYHIYISRSYANVIECYLDGKLVNKELGNKELVK